MRIVANEKSISRRAKVGTIASFASMGLLAVALVLSFSRSPSLLMMQVGLLGAVFVGLLLSFAGGYYSERFAGPAAHYERVREALKGLDKRYTLLQYVLPVPHVLLGPDGMTVIVAKSQAGTITYKEGRWTHRQRGKIFRQLAGQEAVGLPELDVERQVKRLKRALEKRLPEVEVPVRGIVLFVHPEAKLEVEDPPVPTFYFRGKKLKAWLRGPGAGKSLPEEVRKRIEEQLVAPLAHSGATLE